MLLKRPLSIFFVLLLVTATTPHASNDGDKHNIIIVSSSTNKTMHTIASKVSEKLINSRIDAALVDIDNSTLSILSNATLIISVGNQLTENVYREYTDKPILAINTQSSQPKNQSKQFAQLTIKHPLCRQLKLIRALSASFKSVSIIIIDNSLSRSTQRCAEREKLSLNLVKPQQDEPLSRLLSRTLSSDVILATPNRDIYNRNTIKNILLRSYRKRIPVIGFSKSFVNAGALAAIHTVPEQIAEQVLNIIQHHTTKNQFDKQQYYPNKFVISINHQVRKALNLTLPNESELSDSITEESKQ